MTQDIGEARRRFRALHASDTFVIPNAWDAGSARLLESLGFSAIATTSSGFAASLGRSDQHTTLEELESHALSLVAAVDIPVSVDAEHGFSREPAGVARTVERMAQTGVAGISIEDYDPAGEIYLLSLAVERVEAAARAAHASDLVLTARAENHLYGIDDLDDTLKRLVAFERAGADVLYAPGLRQRAEIDRIVGAVEKPVNVLFVQDAPTVSELAEMGVRRISTGGALAFVAYGALMEAARELLGTGTHGYLSRVLSQQDRLAFRS